MIKVLHIITGLDTGGAEMMLYKLLATMDRGYFPSKVVSLTSEGAIGKRIGELGIPVSALDLSPGIRSLCKVWRLCKLIRAEKPDVVQTWMYHADLTGGLAARAAGSVRLLWNVQTGTLDPSRSKRTTRVVMRSCAALSRLLPSRIVCCSEAVREVHARLGYARDKMVVIPNAVSPGEFAPDASARASVRQELGLAPKTVLVGMMARFDPQKDHETFLKAAGMLAAQNPQVHFLLCGSGVDARNQELKAWIKRAGVEQRCHLLGLRHDIPRLTAALDVAVLSSAYGEGLANAILEAMSCGVPCVVTDLGGNAALVADTGRTVPRRDAEALAGALADLVLAGAEKRTELGQSARVRIESCFSLAAAARRYGEVYEGIVRGTRGPGPMDGKQAAPASSETKGLDEQLPCLK